MYVQSQREMIMDMGGGNASIMNKHKVPFNIIISFKIIIQLFNQKKN